MTGCDDPSAIGIGVVDEGGGDPVRVDVEPELTGSQRVAIVSGNISSTVGFAGGTLQMLAGVADDPLFGRIETEGFLDFTAPTLVPGFRDSTIRRAEIELDLLSVYGDTLLPTSIVVSNMDEAWEVTPLRSDTTLEAGSQVTVFEFSGGSTVVLPLPDEWVSEYDSRLRSSNFVEDFHGFRLSGSDPAAVVGFQGTTGVLRLYSGADTVAFPVSKFFTSIRRSSETDYPENRFGVQDGLAEGATFTASASGDSLRGSVVARAALTFQVDTEAFVTGGSFLRPITTDFSLYGVRPDSSRQFLTTSELLADGSVTFVSSTADASQITFVRAIQRSIAGDPEYTHYLLLPSGAPAAVNATLFYGPGSVTPPTLTLTVVRSVD